jgi:adenylosuccinate lyase
MSDALTALSPLDGRYAGKVDALRPIFSEYGLIRARVKVEVEWLLALAAEPGIPELPAVFRCRSRAPARAGEGFSVEDAARVKAIEATTNHDVKAVEYFIKERLQDDAELGPALEFVHFACTSEDINNLSYALMLSKARQRRAAAEARRADRGAARDGAWTGPPADALAHARPDRHRPPRSARNSPTSSPACSASARHSPALPMPGKINGAVGNYNAHVAAYPDVDWPAFSHALRRIAGPRLAALHHPDRTARRHRRTLRRDASASTPSASTCAAMSGATSRRATSSRR